VHFIDPFRLSILDHSGLAFRCDKQGEGQATFLVRSAADFAEIAKPSRAAFARPQVDLGLCALAQ
jgi:hypothetical protein